MARAGSGMDLNSQIAALLRDFGAVQKSKPRMWGYQRAAAAILSLEEPIASFLKADGSLRKIPSVGPSSKSSSSWPRRTPSSEPLRIRHPE